MERLKIVRGEDKYPIIKLRGKQSKDPVDLTNSTNITFVFKKSNRQDLILDTNTIPAVKACLELEGIKIIADTAGDAGNVIILNFNGVDDLDTIVSEWNSDNPTNTVSHNGDGDEIFDGQQRLSGGFQAYAPVEVLNAVLGRIRLTLVDAHTNVLRLGLNQSFKILVDFGPHPTGTRNVGVYENKLDVVE
jgi:hypothetical protein